MGEHAILSASGSEKWLNCTPSIRLEQQFPEENSEYAVEGSFAHKVAELRLKYYLDKKLRYLKELRKLQDQPYYSPELEDYVQIYIDIAIEKINEAKARTSDAVVFIEQKLDFSPWVPDGFGTGDIIIISDKILEIVDLKYGKGVPVSAINNSQMRLYGLGAINQFSCLYDFDTVRMTIVQPRLDSITTDEITIEELLNWGENYVKPRAELAFKGEGEFKAGEHCRFCRARYTCRARAEANLELAKYEFREPALLTHEEIAEILYKADELQSWISDIKAYALDQAENHGVKFPGWKLVEGRSVRKYMDENTVAQTLLTAGYNEEQIYNKSLIGISAMEKLLGKKKFEELLGEFIIKPAGKPTLVPITDKRPEISSLASAREDFKENI